MQTNLNELIPTYAQNKAELDSYKTLCEKENSEIKDAMKELGVEDYAVGEYTAKIIVQHRETMNEEKLIALVRKYDIPNIIQMKPYIDFDALESAIYLGKIPETVVAEMNEAKEVKLVETLKVTKKKEKKK